MQKGSMDVFEKVVQEHGDSYLKYLNRDKLTTLQVNVGNLCNQACKHCHVSASPLGKNIMSKEIVDDILKFLKNNQIDTLDITGGAPEMNPNIKYLIEQAQAMVRLIMLRSNLTILLEKEYADLSDFFKAHNVKLVCSLPCYLEVNVDRQRGVHTFEKSIKALQYLNSIGYGIEDALELDLVYNPGGPFLPPPQNDLEEAYRPHLKEEHGIEFTNLISITNVPIKRFADELVKKGELEEYEKLLISNFNPDVLENIMCRTFISIAYDGTLYDCDFNQALGMSIKDECGKALKIKDLKIDKLEHKRILTAQHCLACTAGSGSSCKGSLA